MELLGDVGHVESHFFLVETMLVSMQDRCMVCSRHTIGLEIVWSHLMVPLVTRLKWKLVSVLLEIVLILTEDRCTVCVERTIGTEIILDAPDGTPR